MSTRRCHRIDDHDTHEWRTGNWPRRTFSCDGAPVTEGGGHWARCEGCGTSGPPHPVGGVECRETAREKAISQGDE